MSVANIDVPHLVASPLPDPVPATEYDGCPVTGLFRRLGDKWTLIVLTLLGQRPYRYNELQRRIEGISQRMLTRTLKALETDRLVRREVLPTVPPSVEYSLTPSGAKLLHPLSELALWAVEHSSAGVEHGSATNAQVPSLP